MEGCWIAAALWSLWYILKIILEAGIFKDYVGAKRTLFLWIVCLGGIGVALYFSFLVEEFG